MFKLLKHAFFILFNLENLLYNNKLLSVSAILHNYRTYTSPPFIVIPKINKVFLKVYDDKSVQKELELKRLKYLSFRRNYQNLRNDDLGIICTS